MTQAFGHRESSVLSGYCLSSSEAVYAKQSQDEPLAASTLCAPATSSCSATPTICTSLPMPAWQLVSESALVHPPSTATSSAAACVDLAFAPRTDAPAPTGVQPTNFNYEKATSNLHLHSIRTYSYTCPQSPRFLSLLRPSLTNHWVHLEESNIFVGCLSTFEKLVLL